MPKYLLIVAVVAAAALGAAQSAVADPTCASTLGIANHGQHVVGDYVTGTGHDEFGWPANGKVGSTIAGSGAAAPGAPGAKGHMPAGVAPGASFCNAQSRSPGIHLGP